MADDVRTLTARLIAGDLGVGPESMAQALTGGSVEELVAAALIAGEDGPLGRAATLATSTRDRQLVAIARAHLSGDDDLVDVLVRDHLSDHPDQVLAAWIAFQRRPPRSAG